MKKIVLTFMQIETLKELLEKWYASEDIVIGMEDSLEGVTFRIESEGPDHEVQNLTITEE